MQAEALITRARLYLRDVTSASIQGEFYSDNEIELSLNVSQNMFVNYCIETEKRYLLNSLIRNTGFSTGAVTLSSLQDSYLHYLSARVGSIDQLARMAQIYLGGTGWGFIYTDHRACIIINDTCTFYEDRQSTNGILYYYKVPVSITSDTSAADYPIQDFSLFTYTNIITKHACTMLGMKEIQSQREFKEYSYKKMQQIVETEDYVRYTGKDIKEIMDTTLNQQPPVYVNAQQQGRQI
jgi:hypothetical protein